MRNSPFKMLDSYNKDDDHRFFGRDKEIAQLYNAVFASNLTLLYGASGTGKTSLVDCGLRNSFFDTDWLPIFIRRGQNLNLSLQQELFQAQKHPMDHRGDGATNIQEQVRALYRDHHRPVYLIFDQFEELFISGEEDEDRIFYQTIADLLESGLQAKVLLIFREEWIAYLNEFERIIPDLFDNRLRIEKMNDLQLFEVVEGTIEQAVIELRDADQTIDAILDNLRDRSKGIELANLQIYLDKLYRNDLARIAGESQPRGVRFDLELVAATRQIEDVLSDFLEEQLNQLEDELATVKKVANKGIPIDILFALVTDDGTKRSLSTAELISRLTISRESDQEEAIRPDLIEYCIERFNQLRIIRIISDD